ncbi:hypothetical protein B0T13DRAFT_229475 [Neurospora crassa]|nr:hypothetical protein B0T13DRAFT_229475 [Neurospora crassa]
MHRCLYYLVSCSSLRTSESWGDRHRAPSTFALLLGRKKSVKAIGENMNDWVWGHYCPSILHSASTCSSGCGVAEQVFLFQGPMLHRFRCTILEMAQAVGCCDGVELVVMTYMLDAGTQMLISNLTKMSKMAKREIGPCWSLAQRGSKLSIA